MKYEKASVSKRLEFGQIFLKAVSESQKVKDLLLVFGVKEDEIEKGKRLLDYAMRMQTEMELSGKPELPEHLKVRFKDAKDDFWSYKQITCIALKKKHQLIIDLFLDRPIDSTIAGFFRQAEHFYNSVIGNKIITSQLSKFNVNDNILIEAKMALDKTVNEFKKHNGKLGDTLQAVRFRDDAMKNLDDWMEDFIRLVQVAIRRHPELYEKLGFKPMR